MKKMYSLEALKRALDAYEPRKITSDLPDAGILVPITRDLDQPKIILTRRAQHMNTHKGQVAFPGGKRDDTDDSLEFTALRECHEEIGIPPEEVEIIGSLSQVISLHGIRVSPFVGLVDDDHPLIPNPEELDSIFKVPVQFFRDAEPVRRDKMTYKGVGLSIPSYHYEEAGEVYEIWGLSAIVLVELMNIAYGMDIQIFDEPVQYKS
jgi:8-oxo-dGTP pyrophosphatase MutT (NUDIX family)